MTKMREFEMVYRDSGTVLPARQTTGWDVATDVAQHASKLAFDIYRAQTAQDAIRFSSAVDSQFHQAYLRNSGNAEGFQKEVDSISSGLLSSMSNAFNRKDFKRILEQKKQHYMMAIAENSVAQQVSMTADEQAQFLGDSMDNVSVHASSLASNNEAMRSMGIDGANQWADQMSGVMDVRDPRTGNYLISAEDRRDYVERLNKRWERDYMYARVRNNCYTTKDIERLREEIREGKVTIPYFSFGEEDGHIKGSVGGSIRVTDDDEIMRLLDEAEEDIRRAEIARRTSVQWASNTKNERIYGICQTQVDDYYQSMREAFESPDPAQRKELKTDFIKRTGTLPTAVWEAIQRSVSGDPNAVAVASEWLDCADSVDPSIVHGLCNGNDALEVAVHRIAGTQSAMYSSENTLRNRVLGSITAGQTPEEIDASVASLALEMYPDSPFARMLADAKPQDKNFLLNILYNRTYSYQQQPGSDTNSVLRCLLGFFNEFSVSTYNTKGDMVYMANPPEKFLYGQFGWEHRYQKIRRSTQLLDKFGRSEFDGLVNSGVLPSGAKYVGTYLYENELTEDGVRRLKEASRRGLNYIRAEGRDGFAYDAYTPYYGAIVRYKDQFGIVHDFPVGDYNPSLEFEMEKRAKGK